MYLEDTVVMINTHRIADYTVTVTSNFGGEVSISAFEVNEGETILLTAIPERGYVIDQIYLYTDGTYAPIGVQLNDTNFEITIPDGNVVIEVSFLCTINPFKDVNVSDYFFHPVMWALSNGVTSGIDATHFAPGQSCTRAQVVTFLFRTIHG